MLISQVTIRSFFLINLWPPSCLKVSTCQIPMEISLWIPGWRVLERVGDDLHEEGTTHSRWLKELLLKCFGFPYQHFGKLDWFSPQLMWRTWEPSHIHHPKFWILQRVITKTGSLNALAIPSHPELFEFSFLEHNKYIYIYIHIFFHARVFCFPWPVVLWAILMLRVTHIFNKHCTFQE